MQEYTIEATVLRRATTSRLVVRAASALEAARTAEHQLNEGSASADFQAVRVLDMKGELVLDLRQPLKGCMQVVVERYMTAKSAAEAGRAFVAGLAVRTSVGGSYIVTDEHGTTTRVDLP